MKTRETLKIVLSGGGTAGSVSPLLAVAEHLATPDIIFVGTKLGIERKLVGDKMPYHAFPAGKLRRYWSWRNLMDNFIIAWAFLYSLGFIIRHRPDVIVTAGSFVSVPLVWAGWFFGVPSIVHQQDLQVGLATKLMKPFANTLTKAFEQISLRGAETIGNPALDLTPTTNAIKIDDQYPTLLIFGGSTGAQALNEAVSEKMCAYANVIHITGLGKSSARFKHERYHVYEHLGAEMKEALHKADLVVCRAGLSTITELSILGKAAVIIPIPDSHQERNAQLLDDHNAAFILKQTQISPDSLTRDCEMLITNKEHLKHFSEQISVLMPSAAASKLASIIETVGKNETAD